VSIWFAHVMEFVGRVLCFVKHSHASRGYYNRASHSYDMITNITNKTNYKYVYFSLVLYFKSLGLMLLPCAEATSIYNTR
jgi:hypothetical protein